MIEIMDFLIAHIFALPLYFKLLILALVFGAQILKPQWLKKWSPAIFVGAVMVVGLYLFELSILQYQSFLSGLLSRVLNQKQGLDWFLNYVRLHFWDQYLISLIGALLFYLAAKYMNDKKGERFFEREEVWLGMLGIFLVGYPGWFFYVALILLLPAVLSLVFLKRNERLPLYYFWLPTAVFVILIVHFVLAKQSWWGRFIF